MQQIRHGRPEDVPTIMALEKSASTAAHWSLAQYLTILSSASRAVLIAEEDGTMGGFLVARCDPEWEIENLVVAEASRNRGLGTRLVVQLLGLARSKGAETMRLEVRETNAVARSLYEKLDFVETGRRRKYYHDPEEDAILYSVRLS